MTWAWAKVDGVQKAAERIAFLYPSDVLDSLSDGCVTNEGSSRICAEIRKKSVLKFAKSSGHYGCNYFGVAQTIVEGLTYQQFPHLPLAKCKLYRIGNFPVLLMEKVLSLVDDMDCIPFDLKIELGEILDVDGNYQVGLNDLCEVVCYDYGCERLCETPENLEKFIKDLPPLNERTIKEFEQELVTFRA